MGQRLRCLRLSLGKTQQEIADALNLSRSAYALYEAGKRQLNYESLCALADFFDVSLDYLFARTETRAQADSFTSEELELLLCYRALDARGQETVRCVAELESRMNEK